MDQDEDRTDPSARPPYGGRDPSRALSLAALGQFDDFRSLYEALAPSLYAWARLRTGSMALDPDDLLQEVWIRALQTGSGFDPAKGSFRAWVFGIAKHVYLEALRKRPARRDVEHVASIDELDRKVLIHCGLEDMPCSLAAVRLGLGVEAVTKRWQRLRAKLRTSGVESLLSP